MNISQTVLAVIAVICSLVLIGCGSRSDIPPFIPVRGEVTYNGDQLTSGEVVYIPIDEENGRPARGTIDENGKFMMETSWDITGVTYGEYAIVVQSFKVTNSGESDPRNVIGKDGAEYGSNAEFVLAIPQKYADRETSGMKATVNKSYPEYQKVELLD